MSRRSPWTSRVAAACGLFAALLGCAGGAPAAPESVAETSILFIGNSLTESNDLAGRVTALSRRTGHPIEASAVTGSGFSLSDHLQDGRAVRAIRGRRWTWVALQQGPSTLPESRADLITSSRTLAEEIRRAGARPALLMAWPLRGQTTAAVSTSYRAAAEAVGARLFPAGDALGLVARRDSSIDLFVSDGFHPTPLGTDVAALTVHCTLFPEDRGALLEALGVVERSLDAGSRRTLVDAACDAAQGI